MSSDGKPMSIKERIAQFEGISGKGKPAPPPQAPHQATTTPPPPVLPLKPVISQPTQVTTGLGNFNGGQVESPSVVRPSAARQSWQAISQKAEQQSPKKEQEAPSAKPNRVWPPPASSQSAQQTGKSTEKQEGRPAKVWPPPGTSTGHQPTVESPAVVRPSKVWPPVASSPPVEKARGPEASHKSSKVWPPPQAGSPGRPSQKQEKGPEKSLNALKQMFEGKITTGATGHVVGGRNSISVQPNSVLPKTKPDSKTREAVEVQPGSAKASIHKMNQFFEAQQQAEKVRAEEQAVKKEQKAVVPPQTQQPQVHTKPTAGSAGIDFLAGMSSPPQMMGQAPKETVPVPVVVRAEEESMAVRLRKKKRAKVHFSSDSD